MQSTSNQPSTNEPTPSVPVNDGSGSVELPSTGTPVYKPEALAWESSSRPERAQWSSSLQQIVAKQFAVLDKAQDISLFCPRFASLTQDQKINLWADLFAVTAYYESGHTSSRWQVRCDIQHSSKDQANEFLQAIDNSLVLKDSRRRS